MTTKKIIILTSSALSFILILVLSLISADYNQKSERERKAIGQRWEEYATDYCTNGAISLPIQDRRIASVQRPSADVNEALAKQLEFYMEEKYSSFGGFQLYHGKNNFESSHTALFDFASGPFETGFQTIKNLFTQDRKKIAMLPLIQYNANMYAHSDTLMIDGDSCIVFNNVKFGKSDLGYNRLVTAKMLYALAYDKSYGSDASKIIKHFEEELRNAHCYLHQCYILLDIKDMLYVFVRIDKNTEEWTLEDLSGKPSHRWKRNHHYVTAIRKIVEEHFNKISDIDRNTLFEECKNWTLLDCYNGKCNNVAKALNK